RLVAETLEVAGDEGDIRDLARGDFAAGELADDGEHAKVQGIHLLVDGRDHRNGGGSRLGKQLDEGAADAHGSGAHVGEHVAELVREGVLRVTDANQGADVSGEVAHALDGHGHLERGDHHAQVGGDGGLQREDFGGALVQVR